MVPLDDLETMDDEQVVAALVTIKGIGRWSAEMFLMFRLHRPDVLPVGDLGIVNAVRKVYGLRKKPTPDRLRRLGEAWKPYRSVASWYLWRSLGNAPGQTPAASQQNRAGRGETAGEAQDRVLTAAPTGYFFVAVQVLPFVAGTVPRIMFPSTRPAYLTLPTLKVISSPRSFPSEIGVAAERAGDIWNCCVERQRALRQLPRARRPSPARSRGAPCTSSCSRR